MPEPKALFRSAAVNAGRIDLFGSIIVSTPPPLRVLSGIAVSFVAGIVAFFSLGAYSSQVTLYGELVPDLGMVRLSSSQDGVVIEHRARAGESVSRGDVLMVLSGERWTDRASAVHEQVSAMLDSRQGTLRRQQERLHDLEKREVAALRDRQYRLTEVLSLLNATLALQQQRVTELTARAADHEGLAAAGYVSAEQERAVRDELTEQLARAQALQRDLLAGLREHEQLEHELILLPLRYISQREEFELALAGIEQERVENDWRRRFAIVAPADGVLLEITADVGAVVSAQTVLLTMIPAGATLQAELQAPETAVWSVGAGDRLRLRFDAFPHQRFGHQGGRVMEIATAPVPPYAAPPVAQESMTTAYRVTVALDSQQVQVRGSRIALKPGMRVQARVVTERRRLYAWVFARH